MVMKHGLRQFRIADRYNVMLTQKPQHKRAKYAEEAEKHADLNPTDFRTFAKKLGLNHPQHVNPLSQ